MEVMESLYHRGFISYPRTETNCYNPTINLREIVSRMQYDADKDLEDSFGFGGFAQRLLTPGEKIWGGPRKGNKDDKAHPPIHPVKLASKGELQTVGE